MDRIQYVLLPLRFTSLPSFVSPQTTLILPHSAHGLPLPSPYLLWWGLDGSMVEIQNLCPFSPLDLECTVIVNHLFTITGILETDYEIHCCRIRIT